MKVIGIAYYANVNVRNSFLHTGFIPGESDIDFTCYYNINNLDNQKHHIMIIRMLKYIFPFMGEVNYYDKYYLEFGDIFNPLEILQDPFFNQLSNRAATNEQKAIFILKKILYNKKFLDVCSLNNRFSKWKFYFSLCEFPYEQRIHTRESFLYNIELFLTKCGMSGYCLFYNYNLTGLFGVHLSKYFYPVDWIYHHYAEIKNNDSFFIAALEWEIMGILSSYRTINTEGLIKHLLLIKKYLLYFKEQNRNIILVENLISRIRNY